MFWVPWLSADFPFAGLLSAVLGFLLWFDDIGGGWFGRIAGILFGRRQFVFGFYQLVFGIGQFVFRTCAKINVNFVLLPLG